MYGSMPVISMNIEGMSHQLKMMMTQYQAQMDSDLNAAVDNFCSGPDIQRIISDTVNKEMKIALEEEVSKFFRYGKGRETIMEAVKKKLLNSDNY